MLVGRRKAETWVHSFSVGSETRKYKGFTIYHITSIVFPRSLPEGLTRVTLWKRFSEVKRLYKELVRRHRERHLAGTVPALTEQSYFKRFDPAVIEERKRYILQLLEFAGQEPVLYLSHAFVSFFARGISPDDEEEDGSLYGDSPPVKENGTKGDDRGNIETIRQTLGIHAQDELSLIDPSRDGNATRTSRTSGGEEEVEEDIQTDAELPAAAPPPVNASMVSSTISETGSALSEQKSFISSVGQSDRMPPEEAMDYLVAAAMVFSKAVEAEANGEYKLAFEHYKAGIDRLLSGAKDDENVTRRKIAKEKSCKYVSKAEDIYDRYLQHAGPGRSEHDLSPIAYDDPSSPIQLLERPLNYLSRYKVVKVIGTVMQVQDVTDKKFYIMKSIRRPPPPGGIWLSSATVFPQDVPYMVPLVAYFQSTDGSIFLLLRLVCAGKLWDFIRSYRRQESYCPSPEELATLAEATSFEEKGQQKSASSFTHGSLPGVGTDPARVEEQTVARDPIPSACDSGFLDLVNEYSNGDGSVPAAATANPDELSPEGGNDETDEVAIEARPDDAEDVVQQGEEKSPTTGDEEVLIPAFDALSKDMDVRDLLSCSQQLLKAVTQTLEESETDAEQKLVLFQPPIVHRADSASNRAIDGTTEANVKSHSSQLGLVRVTSISEASDREEATPDLLPEGSVRRWISELVIAVDSLHFNGIICGDLTMDNLLLGPEGQLMLTYFHRRAESYFSQAGAHPIAPKQVAVRELYVAPERPLEPKSDFWSIGVIMYELLTKRKFVSCHPSGVFSYHEVQYPEGVDLSGEARDLLEELLQPDVERRYDFKEIIASPFFRSVDWSDVKRRGQLTMKHC